MQDSIQALKKKLEAIRDMGFVKTYRAGGTGIGKTLEDLLGMGHPTILNKKAGKKRVRYFTDFDNFLKFTGMLIEGTNWDSVGIQPDNANGSFDLTRLNELKTNNFSDVSFLSFPRNRKSRLFSSLCH